MIIYIVLLVLLGSLGLLLLLLGARPKKMPLKNILPERDALLREDEKGENYALTTGEGFGLSFRKLSSYVGGSADTKKSFIEVLYQRLEDMVGKGLSLGARGKNLAIVERTPADLARQKIGFCLGSSLVLVAFLLLLWLGGLISIPPLVIIVGALVVGLLGYWLPDSFLKTEANKLRKEFEDSMYTWMDLTSQYLNTGEEAGSAMVKASTLSHNWAFRLLNSAMTLSQVSARPVYEGLQRLRRERGLDCLGEFVEALQLSAEYGAGLGDTVRSFIQSYRSQAVIDADTKVKTSAEQAALPLGLVVVGFLILLAYPGIRGVLNTGSGIGGGFGNEDRQEIVADS